MDSRDRQSRIERMKREKQRQERLRRRQLAVVKRCLAVGVIVGAILFLIVGVWALIKPSGQKEAAPNESVENEAEINADINVEEANVITTNDEEPSIEQNQGVTEQSINDGPAAQKPINNPQELKYAVPGWQVDDNGWWYANSDNTYYENGWATLGDKKYFFNNQGYMQTGWTPIGGQGYFFDDAGQHVTDKKPNMIALTFDDGPGKHTERLLDMLKANNAKATFFMVGQSLDGDYGYLVNRMNEEGHELGNHTYAHADLTVLSEEEVRSEFGRVDDIVGEFLPGVRTALTRPPYGAKNEAVLSNIDTPAVFWNVDTNDWQTRNAEMIAEVAIGAKDGSIILMHDIHQETVDACETIIPKLIEAGYELVTVSELARAYGVEMKAGVPYYSFAAGGIATTEPADGVEVETDAENE